MFLIGNEAVEKEGVSWTVTHKDHPAIAIYANPQKVQMGTISLVGLRIERVRENVNLM